jgi:hypothetical protein
MSSGTVIAALVALSIACPAFAQPATQKKPIKKTPATAKPSRQDSAACTGSGAASTSAERRDLPRQIRQRTAGVREHRLHQRGPAAL